MLIYNLCDAATSESGQFDNLLLKKQTDVSFSCDISRKTVFDHIS